MINEEKLKERVRSKIVTQKQIAKSIPIDNSYLSAWLNGKKELTLDMLDRINKGLKNIK